VREENRKKERAESWRRDSSGKRGKRKRGYSEKRERRKREYLESRERRRNGSASFRLSRKKKNLGHGRESSWLNPKDKESF
jgi:hypothetical protein